MIGLGLGLGLGYIGDSTSMALKSLMAIQDIFAFTRYNCRHVLIHCTVHFSTTCMRLHTSTQLSKCNITTQYILQDGCKTCICRLLYYLDWYICYLYAYIQLAYPTRGWLVLGTLTTNWDKYAGMDIQFTSWLTVVTSYMLRSNNTHFSEHTTPLSILGCGRNL